jgi:hypothetical protein
VPAYWFDSRRRYFLKNHGLVHAALADSAFLFGHALLRLRRALTSKPMRDPPHMLGDFVKNGMLVQGVGVEPARTT